MRKPCSREDVAILAAAADLNLAPEYLDELVEAFSHVEVMLRRLRRNWPQSAEPAHIFDPRAIDRVRQTSND